MTDAISTKNNTNLANDDVVDRYRRLSWREQPELNRVAECSSRWWDENKGGDYRPRPDRLCLNYLRHEFTTYDEAVAGLSDKSAEHDAIKIRVLGAIAAKYPSLRNAAVEQARQIQSGSADVTAVLERLVREVPEPDLPCRESR